MRKASWAGCKPLAAAGVATAGAAAMFFHLIMPAEVELHPRHFGPTMRAILEQKLTREVHCSLAAELPSSAA